MSDQQVYAIIMAGGKGERFWPQSRASHPKQLLRLMGNLTMIEQATERLIPVVPEQNIIIITNREYVNAMQQLLHRVPEKNIIGEYTGRDTAACMALATGIIHQRAGAGKDPVIVVSPADHIIRNTAKFRQTLADSIKVAANCNKLITWGIEPRFPSTGFGYIETGLPLVTDTQSSFFEVRKFTEKPSLALAEDCISQKKCKWNSGFFIWRYEVIMNTMRELAPELFNLANEAYRAECDGDLNPVLENSYRRVMRISIDYAIMEKCENIAMAVTDFDWEDVGSWSALRSQARPNADNNIIRGLVACLDTTDSMIVSSPNHLVAAIDVRNLIIVHTDDATLVCAEQSAQRVKELVQELNKNPEFKKFL